MEQKAADYGPIRMSELELMCRSTRSDDRLFALVLMRRDGDAGLLDQKFLSLATDLLSDNDNDIRWQAAIVIGAFIEGAPDKVWDVILRFGDSDETDTRTAVGTVLLEPLLQRHGSRYRPLVDQLAHRSPRFAEMCRVRSDFSDE
jgi:hypothetical protein